MGRATAAAALVAAAAAAGCAGVAPPTGQPLRLAAAADPVAAGRGVLVDAAGSGVAVAPPPGLCVDPAAAHATTRAMVLMVEPCGAAAASLMRMVTVSATPVADGVPPDAALDAMVARARAEEGWRDVGLGLGHDLEVLTAERDGPAAYFVVEDMEGEGDATPLGRRCRAVAEIAGRMVIVTVAAPPGAAPEPDLLQAEARRVLDAIAAANPPRAAAPAAPRPRPSLG